MMRKMFFTLIIIVLFSVLFAENWVVSPNITLSTIKLNTKDTTNDLWTHINAEGSEGYIYNYGSPKIPVYRKIIYVPKGSSVNAYISAKVLKKEMIVDNTVEPLLKSARKIKGEESIFEYDEKTYSILYPINDIDINYKGIVRGMDIYEITVMPIKYLNKKLYVYEYNVNINITEKLMDNRLYSSAFKLFYSENNLKSVISLPIKMVFITPSYYEDTLKRYTDWKYQMGYDVVIADEYDITDWTNEGIKSYIQNAYDNWDIPPTYVILIGDVSDVPTDTVSIDYTFNTDQTYALLDGDDYYPDIYIGRISVSNNEELNNVIDKMIAVDQGIFSTNDWMNKAQFIASSDGSYWQVSENTHNYVIDDLSLVNSFGFTCYKTYPVTYNATEQDIATNINNGVLYNIYSGHGNPTGYYDYDIVFTTDSIDLLLNNSGMYPFNAIHACQTHDFDYSSVSGGEAWLRKKDGGAFTSWGATIYTYWTEDDTLERAWFRSCFYDSNWTIGQFTQDGLHAVDNSGSDLAEYYFMEYNILGDPSIMLRSKRMDTLFVEYPSKYNYPSGDVEITVYDNDKVTPIKNALVSIYIPDTDLHVAGYTDSDGKVFLSYDNIDEPDTMFVVVTAHDYTYFQGQIESAMGAPSRPTILNPMDDAWVNPSNMILRFYTTDEEGDSVAYRIWWSVNSDNFDNAEVENVPGIYAQGDTVIYNSCKRYSNAFVYFKVQAIDPHGDSLWSGYSYTKVLKTNDNLTSEGWYQSTNTQLQTASLLNALVENGDIIPMPPTRDDTIGITSFERIDDFIIKNINGDSTWKQTNEDVYDGSYSMEMDYSLSDEDDWLIINKPITIEQGDSLLFAQKGKWSEYTKYHGLWYSETGTDITSFSELYSALPIPSSEEWEMNAVDLSIIEGKTVYLAFRYQGYNADIWYLDNINKLSPQPSDTAVAVSKSINASDFFITPENYGQAIIYKSDKEDSILIYIEGYDGSSWSIIKGPFCDSEHYIVYCDISDILTSEYNSIRLKAIMYPYETKDAKYPSIRAWGVDPSLSISYVETDKVNNASQINYVSKPYPNPFKNNVSFRFSLMQDAIVRINLYDISGRKQLEHEYSLKKGISIVSLKEKLNAGVYFYSITVNGANMDKGKLIILE